MNRVGLMIALVAFGAPRTGQAKGREWSKEQIQQAVMALCIASNTTPAFAPNILGSNAADPFPALKRLSTSKGRVELTTFETGHPAAPRLTIAALGNTVVGLEVELKPGSFDRVRGALSKMRRLKLAPDEAGRVYAGPYDSVWGSGQVTLVRDPDVVLKCTRPPDAVPAAAATLVRELSAGRFADVAARSDAGTPVGNGSEI